LIFEDAPEPLVVRNFEGSLMIIREGVKYPPQMRNLKGYFLGLDKNPLLS